MGRHEREETIMSDERPNPLGDAAGKVGSVVAGLIGVIGAAVQLGYLSSEQGNALVQAGQSLPNVVLYVGAGITLVTGIVGGVLSAFRTAAHAKDHVTPLSSPRDANGTPLVPLSDGAGPSNWASE